jgi:uncharacterized protein (DUF488 family)
MTSPETQIWTVGHSNRTETGFIDLLRSFDITTLADIRTFPGSAKYPHFNKESLALKLADCGIRYVHLPQLGGRRKPKTDSVNTAWRNSAFRGYADHMGSTDFKEGIKLLEQMALESRTAYMCSEAVWWRCHRALVSDHLKNSGWKVDHIMDKGKSQEHPYTSAARADQGNLFYN